MKYYIVKNIYGYPYEFEFTGMTKGKVPPENIISIEEIKGYIQMQEKYPDYVEFYNEIEWNCEGNDLLWYLKILFLPRSR